MQSASDNNGFRRNRIDAGPRGKKATHHNDPSALLPFLASPFSLISRLQGSLERPSPADYGYTLCISARAIILSGQLP